MGDGRWEMEGRVALSERVNAPMRWALAVALIFLAWARADAAVLRLTSPQSRDGVLSISAGDTVAVNVEIARTRGGVPGVVADVTSAVPAAMRAAGRVLSVPATCQVAAGHASVLLPGLRRRRLEFPLTQLQESVEGQAGPRVEVEAGDERLFAAMPRLWLAVAPHRRDITIDGDLQEWEGIPELSMDRQAQATYMPANWRGPQDGSVRIRMAWNEEDLLLAAHVTDGAVHPTRRLYAGECIELFLNMDHTTRRESTPLETRPKSPVC